MRQPRSHPSCALQFLIFVVCCLFFLDTSVVAWQPLQRWRTNRSAKNKPIQLAKAPKLPTLKYRPLLGLLPSIQEDFAQVVLVHAEYCQRQQLPGVRLNAGIMGNFDMLVDPKLVNFVMTDAANICYKSALDRRGVGLLTGQGSLLSDGEAHTRKRRLVLPSLVDRSSLTKFLSIMHEVSLEYAASTSMTKGTNSTLVNVAELFSAIAMKIIGLSLFSANVVDGEIYRDISICLEHVIWVTRNPVALPSWIPTRRNRRFRQSLARLDALVYSLIQEGQTRTEAKGDLLTMLLAARYDEGGPKLNDKELRDEIMTLFLAGHETTAITLCWTLWYLSDPQNIYWQDKIVKEYDKVVQEFSGFTPSIVEDAEALKNTRAVLCESLRLRTPSYAMDREVQEQVIAPGNILWKKGAILLISPLAMHMNPNHFENPEVFDPTRFLQWKDGKDMWDGPYDRSVYLPFGAGRKRCIGYKFAQWEALVILGALLKHFKVQRPLGRTSVKWEPGVTLRPDRDLELMFESRDLA